MYSTKSAFLAVIILTVLLFIMLSCVGKGKIEPTLIFEKAFGGEKDDFGSAVALSPDGGYVIAGSTRSHGSGMTDVYVIKTDRLGDVLGQTTFGGSNNDFGYGVAATPDGGYVIAGATSSLGAGQSDVYLVRLDRNGDSLWARTYGGALTDEAWAVAVTADSGFIIAGSTYSFGAGDKDVYVIRTDSDGDTLWTRAFGGVVEDYARSVVTVADGGFVVVGSTYSFGSGDKDMYAIKLNASGDSIWAETYGKVAYERAFGIAPTLDRGFVICGSTHSTGVTGGETYLVKIDADGNQQWEKTYGGQWARKVTQSTDGGFILVGETLTPFNPEVQYNLDIYLVKIDSDGELQWKQAFGGDQHEFGYDIVNASDGGFFVAGVTKSYGAGGSDIYFLKVEEK
ncbi:MAG: hypothetical protein JSV44_06515 [Candidatus Zixiibacteriota bacterium]|nr:MAG: hypothetical protein JSV44_06515 [candidate division Zixibacteria bacterium]